MKQDTALHVKNLRAQDVPMCDTEVICWYILIHSIIHIKIQQQ